MQETPEQTYAAAKRSLAVQREGGTHRPGPPIGKGSAEARSSHIKRKLTRMAIAFAAIWTFAVGFSLAVDAIGQIGLMLTVLACVIALGVFAIFPRMKTPKRIELGKGNPKRMVANTELWLEAQRASLPAPAAALVDKLGVQLDALGLQLEHLDENQPAMDEVRELVGEYIPETIDDYRKIPAHMRSEQYAGKTADERLVESLTKLSGEVDRVTRKLAEGALDDLAVKSRYLEYRYGGDELLADMPDQGSGVPLPDFAADKAKAPR